MDRRLLMLFVVTAVGASDPGVIQTKFYSATGNNSLTHNTSLPHEIQEARNSIDCARLCALKTTCLQTIYSGDICHLYNHYTKPNQHEGRTFHMDFTTCDAARSRINSTDRFVSVNGSQTDCYTDTPTSPMNTESPTTISLTTKTPTAESPTPESPTTESPTPESPTTESPTPESPTTESPAPESPTTESPTPESPTTESPSTESPTTQDPCSSLQTPAPEGTVIQRRINGSLDFYRGWDDYVAGFGDPEGEFWIGLETLHHLTPCPVRISIYMERLDTGAPEWANYSSFSVGDAGTNYTLSVGGTYAGTVIERFTLNNGHAFSTYDRDNDVFSGKCAEEGKSGWWHEDCTWVNLNGRYGVQNITGIWWDDGYRLVYMKTVIIRIHP